MKNVFLSAVAALLFSASVQAQSTVDSIAAKYKLVPMPEPLTIEKTFPVLGSYTLNTPMASSSMSTTTSTDAATTTTTSTSGVTTDASGMSTAANVTITLDSANKGLVWVEGLPQGKFKAFLKQSPATYRIISQKSETGTQIPEGTLYFDPSSKVLNIAIGKAYDETNPTGIFSMAAEATANTEADEATGGKTVKVKTKTPTSKKKEKVIFYTATKIEAAPATSTTTEDGAQQQQQATDSTQQNQTQPQTQNQQQ